MIILALDTCLNACSAAVVHDGRTLAAVVEPMTRGHQERLGGMVGEVMAKAGLAFCDLDRIGVTVGPGSFTGLRVGLAFAKGLGLALSIPCVGVGALDALAGEADGFCAAVVDAKHGQAYWRLFQDGAALTEPVAGDIVEGAGVIASHVKDASLILTGSGAALMAQYLPKATMRGDGLPDPAAVARLAAAASAHAGAAPLYLRPPYATLPA